MLKLSGVHQGVTQYMVTPGGHLPYFRATIWDILKNRHHFDHLKRLEHKKKAHLVLNIGILRQNKVVHPGGGVTLYMVTPGGRLPYFSVTIGVF